MKLSKAVRFGLVLILAAVSTSLVFFGLLALWGLVVAPFVVMGSARIVVATALLLAMAITVLLFNALQRRLVEKRYEKSKL
ncbi:hypothetical protein MASR2M29_18840 [Spirochaetota bacterium]